MYTRKRALRKEYHFDSLSDPMSVCEAQLEQEQQVQTTEGAFDTFNGIWTADKIRPYWENACLRHLSRTHASNIEAGLKC